MPVTPGPRGPAGAGGRADARARFTIRTAAAGDFGAYMDAFEAVAAEGRWMGAEAPIDRAARRATFDRAVEGDGAVLFLAVADGGAGGGGGGGGIVGACYGSVAGGIADLGMFVVDGWRGAGVGAALLAALIEWARRGGAHKVSLAAWTSNHPAIGLYARFGFRVEGVRRRHYRRRSGALWDSVVMGLVLDESSPGGPAPVAAERPSIAIPAGGLAGAAGALAGGGEVVLREGRAADGPVLIELMGEPDIRRTLDGAPGSGAPADDAAEYLARARGRLTAGTAAPLAVVVDGEVVGSAGLYRAAHDAAVASLGYWVGARARGRGVATAATRLLCEFGFGVLALRRVEITAPIASSASRRVAEKAGFTAEGVRRAWRTVDGVPTDFAVYSRVAEGAV